MIHYIVLMTVVIGRTCLVNCDRLVNKFIILETHAVD